jgi:hypothetical protein
LPTLICCEHKRIAGHIETRQDFLGSLPPVKQFPLKIALFYGLPRVVGGVSAPFAVNRPKSRNFSARAGSFRYSAELLKVQRIIPTWGSKLKSSADYSNCGGVKIAIRWTNFYFVLSFCRHSAAFSSLPHLS